MDLPGEVIPKREMDSQMTSQMGSLQLNTDREYEKRGSMRLQMTLLCLLASLSSHAMAEHGCPPGQIPYQAGSGMASCGPIPAESNKPQAPRPTGKWIKTWGAITYDKGDSGSIGVSVGHRSQKEAEKIALSRCVEGGGVDCKVMLPYHNQCAAVAEPVGDGVPNHGYISSAGGPTIEQARDTAIQQCSKINESDCRVFYSDCSKPIFKPFR